MSKNFSILRLVGSIIICQLAGFLGSLFTVRAIPTWYAQLAKPSFNPPNWLFMPVWLILYTLMGISLYFIWSQDTRRVEVKKALVLFAMQLVLNMLWTIVFFGLHSLLGSALLIIVLLLAILFTILRFHKLSPVAGYLLVPYLVWVSYAAVLNWAIFFLNR
jgi:benzodiazapine receptor